MSTMIFSTAADDSVDMVSSSLGIGEFFQDKYTNPFTSHIAIGCRRKGFATSIFREHACFAVTDMQFGRDQSINTADDGRAAHATLDSTHPLMNGHQRTRACCLNRFAWSVQIQ